MMTKDEALKMAIEAMNSAYSSHGKILTSMPAQDAWLYHGCDAKLFKALQACKEALEQPAQEPVAWLLEYRYDEFDYWHKNCDEDKLALEMWFDAIRYDTTEHKIYPLYTHPAPLWQGLSDEEIETIMVGKNGTYFNFARAIEQALKEKNGKV